MLSDNFFTNKAVLQSFLVDTREGTPPARRALQELPQLQRAPNDAEAMCVCEEWARRQSNCTSGTANIFGLASEFYKQRTSACRSAAERILQGLAHPDRVGLTPNQRLASALMLDSMGKPRPARAVLGRDTHADAVVRSAGGGVLTHACAHENERLSKHLDWWPWIARHRPGAMPEHIEFNDPHLGPVSLGLATGSMQ